MNSADERELGEAVVDVLEKMVEHGPHARSRTRGRRYMASVQTTAVRVCDPDAVAAEEELEYDARDLGEYLSTAMEAQGWRAISATRLSRLRNVAQRALLALLASGYEHDFEDLIRELEDLSR